MDISGFARPLTINPQSQPHKQTIILLHGRGSNSTEFGPALLFRPLRAHHSRLHLHGGGSGSSSNSSNNFTSNSSNNNNNGSSSSNGISGRNRHNNIGNSPAAAYYHRRGSSITLREALPHAKFIFPTAVSLHAKALDGCAVNQWFDNWPLAPMVASWSSSSSSNASDSSAQKDNDTLPIPGLQQTVRFLHHLIQTEIDELGGDASSVVVGGFSQGSAASLIAALLWEGESLGAWVGMSGWMPFTRQIQQAAEAEAETDPDPAMALQRGVEKLKTILDFPISPSAPTSDEESRNQISIEHTPLFMAHGLKDDKAPVILSRMVRSCLEALHLDIHHKEYEYGEHECSEEALCDVVNFLWERLTH